MIATASKNGLEIFTNNELLEIKNSNDVIIANCSNGNFQGKKYGCLFRGRNRKI